ALIPFERRHRAGVDDRAALLHVRQRRLHHVNVPEDVRSERPLELLLADVENRFLLLLIRGVVDEDVEPSEFLHDTIDERAALRATLHVESMRERATPRLFDEPHRFLRVAFFFLGEVADRDVRTFTRKRDRNCATNSAVAAGDDRRATVELSRSAIALLAMIGR